MSTNNNQKQPAVMDAKEMQLFEHYYRLLSEERFDEKDIYAFLILIRRMVEQIGSTEGWLFDICNFVAHRQRNKGRFFRNALAIQKSYVMQKLPYQWTQKERSAKRVPGVNGLDNAKFICEFNSFLRLMGYNALQRHTIEDIILCILSLMQNSIYLVSSEGNKFDSQLTHPLRDAELRILVSDKQIILFVDNDRGGWVNLGALKNRYENQIHWDQAEGEAVFKVFCKRDLRRMRVVISAGGGDLSQRTVAQPPPKAAGS